MIDKEATAVSAV